MFEVVCGVASLSNVEIASYPYGYANVFLRYFSPEYKTLFSCIKSQVFGKTIPADIIVSGSHYGICYSLLGLEARTNALGYKMIDKGLPMDISFVLGAILSIFSGKLGQQYRIFIDGEEISGEFASILIANTPCYGLDMYPAIDAHPDDGILDIYLLNKASRLKTLLSISTYVYGGYRKIPSLVTHYTARKIKITSDETICTSIDGELIYTMSAEYAVLPKAVNFVIPDGIDMSKIPKIYKSPKEGMKN